jgi:hypothetical protein
VEDESVRYGPIQGWAQLLKVSVETLTERLKGIPPVRGLSPQGDLIDFYAENDVRKACPELFPKK